MSLGSHIEELKKKHQVLSAAVDKAQRSPGMSDQEIRELKKEKLRIKEQITRLS
ncbi:MULTISPECIES: YdcH family protein [Rhodobacterales]|uniref:YdcH family protein n=1 Tax=Rhodobacterales TaxID=204455 RepID=UPI004058837A